MKKGNTNGPSNTSLDLQTSSKTFGSSPSITTKKVVGVSLENLSVKFGSARSIGKDGKMPHDLSFGDKNVKLGK